MYLGILDKQAMDEELEEVNGGRNLFDVFTAEFRGEAKNPTTLEMILDSEDDNKGFGLNTLEMRTNPLKKQESAKRNKIVKL